jgi:hypothetical protein
MEQSRARATLEAAVVLGCMSWHQLNQGCKNRREITMRKTSGWGGNAELQIQQQSEQRLSEQQIKKQIAIRGAEQRQVAEPATEWQEAERSWK